MISVVVPTLNRKESLMACLQSLERQSYEREKFEVVIVDDGSTDGTEAAVQEYIRRSLLTIRYYNEQRSGPGAARNLGVHHSQGEIIAFIEDDVLAHEHWLRNGANYFMETGVACVEGRTELQQSTESLRVFDADEFLSFIPCNLFVRKELFLKVGGYDPEYFDEQMKLYFREDADFGFKLLNDNASVKRAGDVIIRHPVLYRSVKDYFTHVRRYYFDPLLYRKHPADYRKYIEKKVVGGFALHRPFHYLSLFYILLFLFIFIMAWRGNTLTLYSCVGVLLIVHAGIRFRYERSLVPKLWKVEETLAVLALPFYYYYWFIRGCVKFKSWGSLI
jgi:glycosyltransferase involved in cell wall biosynthesis